MSKTIPLFVSISHFNITNNFNQMILSIATLYFAMEGMVFGGPTTFSPILIIPLKNGNITQRMVIWCPTKLTGVKPLFLKILFMFWVDKRLMNQQALHQKKATKFGHLIFLHESGQIEEKGP